MAMHPKTALTPVVNMAYIPDPLGSLLRPFVALRVFAIPVLSVRLFIALFMYSTVVYAQFVCSYAAAIANLVY